jgi:hypothetical protein
LHILDFKICIFYGCWLVALCRAALLSVVSKLPFLSMVFFFELQTNFPRYCPRQTLRFSLVNLFLLLKVFAEKNLKSSQQKVLKSIEKSLLKSLEKF